MKKTNPIDTQASSNNEKLTDLLNIIKKSVLENSAIIVGFITASGFIQNKVLPIESYEKDGCYHIVFDESQEMVFPITFQDKKTNEINLNAIQDILTEDFEGTVVYKIFYYTYQVIIYTP